MLNNEYSCLKARIKKRIKNLAYREDKAVKFLIQKSMETAGQEEEMKELLVVFARQKCNSALEVSRHCAPRSPRL